MIKILMPTIALLLSTSVFAANCPKLEGKWVCDEDSKRESIIEIKQFINEEGFTQYDLTNLTNPEKPVKLDPFITDNKFYHYETKYSSRKERTHCQSDIRLQTRTIYTRYKNDKTAWSSIVKWAGDDYFRMYSTVFSADGVQKGSVLCTAL